MKQIADEIQILPNGSRFYRCAFQVNAYKYVKRHNPSLWCCGGSVFRENYEIELTQGNSRK